MTYIHQKQDNFTRTRWKKDGEGGRGRSITLFHAKLSISSDARCREKNSICRALKSESNVVSYSRQQHFLFEQSVTSILDGRTKLDTALPGTTASILSSGSERANGIYKDEGRTKTGVRANGGWADFGGELVRL